MKKVLLLLTILLFPIWTYAKEEIEINSIQLEENFQVIENRPSSVEGKEIYLDLTFSRVDSYITYQLNIENHSNDNYVVDKNSFSIKDDYMNYSIQCDTPNNSIPPKSNGNCFIKITYQNAVSDEQLIAGNIKEEKNLDLNLLKSNLINPSTRNNIGTLLILLLFLILISTRNNKKNTISLIILLLLIPMMAQADHKITFIIHSNIEIAGNSRKCSHNPRDIEEYFKCLIETDIYDWSMDELERRKADPTAPAKFLPDDIEEAKRVMDDYDYLISTLAWNYEEKNGMTKENYQNYVDGIYYNGSLINPFYYGEETLEGTPEQKKLYIDNIITLTKPKETDSFRYIQNSVITSEGTSKEHPDDLEYSSADISFPVTGSITIYREGTNSIIEIEKVDINIDIQTSVARDSTGKIIIGGWPMNPECISLTLLHRKNQLLNNFTDIYVNMKRRFNSGQEYFDYSEYNEILFYLNQLYTRGKPLGYFHNDSFDDFIQNNPFVIELSKNMNIKLVPKSHWQNEEYLDEVDYWGYPIINPDFLREFYDYFQIPYDRDNPQMDIYNSDPNRFSFIYKSKLYEGENAFYRLCADIDNLDITNTNDIKLALYEHWLNKANEP